MDSKQNIADMFDTTKAMKKTKAPKKAPKDPKMPKLDNGDTMNRGVALKAIAKGIAIEKKAGVKECDKRIKKAVEQTKKVVAQQTKIEKDIMKQNMKEKKALKDSSKPKRAPSAYNMFVKANYQNPEVQALPFKERLSKIGMMWKAQKP